VSELLKELAARDPLPAVGQARGVVELDVGDAGRWLVTLADGAIRHGADSERPDSVIRCGAADLADIVAGRRNLLTAVLQGRVWCRGDPALVLTFHRLLRAGS
jgi:hypothetical protein